MSEEGQPIETKDRIVIMIDPFTRQANVYNYTKSRNIGIDGLVDIQPNEKSEVTISLNVTLTLEGMICKFKNPPESEDSE